MEEEFKKAEQKLVELKEKEDFEKLKEAEEEYNAKLEKLNKFEEDMTKHFKGQNVFDKTIADMFKNKILKYQDKVLKEKERLRIINTANWDEDDEKLDKIFAYYDEKEKSLAKFYDEKTKKYNLILEENNVEILKLKEYVAKEEKDFLKKFEEKKEEIKKSYSKYPKIFKEQEDEIFKKQEAKNND